MSKQTFTKTELKQMQARVNRGAKLLDKKKKGWERLVKMNRLKMDTWDCCILGQLFGDYFHGTPTLGIVSGVSYGFIRDEFPNMGEYAQLGKMWKSAIRQRRLRGKQ